MHFGHVCTGGFSELAESSVTTSIRESDISETITDMEYGWWLETQAIDVEEVDDEAEDRIIFGIEEDDSFVFFCLFGRRHQ